MNLSSGECEAVEKTDSVQRHQRLWYIHGTQVYYSTAVRVVYDCYIGSHSQTILLCKRVYSQWHSIKSLLWDCCQWIVFTVSVHHWGVSALHWSAGVFLHARHTWQSWFLCSKIWYLLFSRFSTVPHHSLLYPSLFPPAKHNSSHTSRHSHLVYYFSAFSACSGSHTSQHYIGSSLIQVGKREPFSSVHSDPQNIFISTPQHLF